MTTKTEAAVCEELAKQLYLARQVAKVAKQVFRDKAAEVGVCESRDKERGACYYFPSREPCEICAVKIPLWKAYRTAAHKAGAILNRLLNAGKRMAESNHE